MTGADLLARIEDWMKGNEASWQDAVLQVVDNEYGLEGPWPETPPFPSAPSVGEPPPPGWKVNNPHWPAGEGEYLIPEEAETEDGIWPALQRFALAETPPGSRIGQFLDLKAPMEREPGFLRHRENGTGTNCLFCGSPKPWLSLNCGATAEALAVKINKVAARREELLWGSYLAVSFDSLLTRLRNRRDLIVLASVPDLRVPHYPED